jgi:hypothetical protein
MLKKIFLISIIILTSPVSSLANLEEKFIINSTYHNWTVFENKNSKDKQCYIASFPIGLDQRDVSRKNSYIKITFYKNNKVQEFSSSIGIKFKLNSPSFLLIEDRKFELFTDGDFIWLKTKQEDKELIELMLKSAYLKVRSNSAFGSFSIDEYSLNGFNMAYAMMKSLCQKENNI